MKLHRFLPFLALLRTVNGSRNVNDVLASGQCASCAEQTVELLRCGLNAGCDYEACLADFSSYEDLQSCCPACSDKFDSTVECFEGCLPNCVYETSRDYAGCALLRQCEGGCKAAIEDAAADANNTVVTLLEDGNYDIALAEIQGQLEDVSIDTLTCSFFEEEFETKVCDIANCCPDCIDEFELVAECLINEVLYNDLLDSNTTCDVECGSNGSRFPGRGNGRLLQPPNLPPPLGEGDLPVNFEAFESCESVIAVYMALGRAEGAYDAYMACFLVTLARPLDGEMETAPPTESPTEGNGGQGAGGQPQTTGLKLVSVMGSIALLSIVLL